MGFFKKVDQWLTEREKQFHTYFRYAVVAYMAFDDEEAKLAAIVAAKKADHKMRESMMACVSAGIAEFTADDLIKKRMQEIQEAISAKDWRILDAVSETNRPYKRNPGYGKALNKEDPSVFVHKYPSLFGDPQEE